jgi:DNA helicase-2/ATP-dependent DNA helicase PcrA
LSSVERARSTDVSERVRQAATRDGWVEPPPEGAGERELTRQRDLARLVDLADELDGDGRTLADYVAAVRERFGGSRDSEGVNLLTLHRSKGLEFEAVFIPRVQEGELPFRRSTGAEAVAEERRLLYVGITRARRYLFVTWVARGRHQPSRFVADVVPERGRAGLRRERDAGAQPAPSELLRALKSWRRERARRDQVPAYVVFHDRTIEAIAAERPQSLVALGAVPGVGPTKIERYGSEILATIATVATTEADGDRADASR